MPSKITKPKALSSAERKQIQRKKQGSEKYALELKENRERKNAQRDAKLIAPALLVDIELTEKYEAEIA